MTPEVLIALFSLVGTAIGSLTGIFLNNRLVVYRLTQLEEKVEKHNNLVERMAVVETEIDRIDVMMQE